MAVQVRLSFCFRLLDVCETPSRKSRLSYVHDAKFGQFMVQQAMNSSSPSSTFDELAFAKGFLGHGERATKTVRRSHHATQHFSRTSTVLGDLIGFFRDAKNHGILCTDVTGGCTPTDVLYIGLWDLMSTLDAFYLAAVNVSRLSCDQRI